MSMVPDPVRAMDVVTRAGEVLTLEPMSPAQLEAIIFEVGDLLDKLPGELKNLNERRYNAERAWSRKKNAAMVQHAGMGVTFARAQAELDAMPEREAADIAKAAWHYADDTMKSLTSRLYGYLNINKGVQAAYQMGGGRS